MTNLSPHSSSVLACLSLPLALGAIPGVIQAQAGPWQENEVETMRFFEDALEAVDLDGDGDLDVQGGFLWYENTAGDGSTWERHNVNGSDHSVAFDLDQDGDLDLVSMDPLRWTENVDGSGPEFVSHSIYDAPLPIGVVGLSVQDLDLDGDPDVVSADIFHDAILWHENTAGDASAWATHPITAQAKLITSFSTADVDGDGDADVFAGETSFVDPVGYYWYENRLSGGLSWAKHFMAGSVIADNRKVRAADVDGDGDVDAMVASHWALPATDNTVAWIENVVGDGSSWTRHLLGPASLARTNALAPSDLDRDGDTDLLLATELGLSWYENLDGRGSSWSERSLFSSSPSEQCAFGDVDSDGDLDVLATRRLATPTGMVKLSWYENETPRTPYGSDVNPPRSLRVMSGELALDQAVVFGLDNPLGTQAPGALSFLFVADAPAPSFPAGTLLPGFGMGGPGANGELLIDLGPTNPRARLTGPAWSGAGNPALISIRVPNAPALVGRDFYFQGLLIDPGASLGVRFGLTNGIRATIGP